MCFPETLHLHSSLCPVHCCHSYVSCSHFHMYIFDVRDRVHASQICSIFGSLFASICPWNISLFNECYVIPEALNFPTVENSYISVLPCWMQCLYHSNYLGCREMFDDRRWLGMYECFWRRVTSMRVSVSVDSLFYFCCTSLTNHGLCNKDLEAFCFSPRLHTVIG